MILILAVLCLLVLPVRAEQIDEDTGIDISGAEEGLPQDVLDELPQPGQTTDFWSGAKELFRQALRKSSETFRSGLLLCAILLAIVTLCSVAGVPSGKHGATAVTAAGAIGICAAVLSTFQSMISLATDTVEKIADYSACLMPVMASAAAMSGKMTSGTALYAGTLLFAELLMQLISKLLVPAVFFYLAVSTAEAALAGEMLAELRSFVGWLISKLLRIIMFGFLGYMSLTGVISGAADAAAVKATKAAVSGMVPVVGGIISDASETLLASASALKSSVGIFGMLAVLGVCLTPFLRVGVHYLLLKLTAAVSGVVGSKPHVALLKNYSTAMGYLLAMCGSCGMLLLISLVCFLKVAA